MATKNLGLETQVQYVKGIGPKLGELLAKRDIYSVRDLIEYFPRTYEDRRAARNIGTLRADDLVSLKANIVHVSSYFLGRTKRKIYDLTVRDQSGQIHCKYFRVPYRGYFERFEPGMEVRVIGKVTDYRGKLEFHHPELRDLEDEEELKDELIPVYMEIENLSSAKILRLIRTAFENLEVSAEIVDLLPPQILKKQNLVSRAEALKSLHYPDAKLAERYQNIQSPGHQRIIFEELFWLELYLAAKRSEIKREKGIILKQKTSLSETLIKSLPFKLTAAQNRVLEEIYQDVESSHPMNRLLQGDVGSGKTLVAFLACIRAIENEGQTTLMAPTEILAEQHFKGASRLLEPLGIKVAILTGKIKAAERKLVLADLQNGKIHLLIGTQALIEDPVQFKNLALAVVDEQHRFGVEQRGKLKAKGGNPHILVMTATPIPRTLAMTVYGDLDVSIIDELPPGRIPIQTRVTYESKRPEVLKFVGEQISKGRQCYFIYPLVEESEKMDFKNAMDEYEKLKVHFSKYEVGLLHGRLKSEEKEQIMQDFYKGKTQILVSTTVIEVGVDVPNANIIVIEHSERFGLSQLHQLRGRVGRGQHKSFCILSLGRAVSHEARDRTLMMERTNDGFKIAEFDLELRGPGEFLGTRQSGLPGFRMANLLRDHQILIQARECAFQLFQNDPQLNSDENRLLKTELFKAHGPLAMASIS